MMVNQDEQVYEYNKGVGASRYRLTELDTPTIERPPPDFAEQLTGMAGTVLDVLDWVWENFPGFPEGQGFLESIVTPFSGNPDSIRANANAWEAVGRQFAEMVVNMAANATKLLAHSWEGDAAEGFDKFLKTYWKDGAAWAGEQLGKILRTGFDKVADAADKIAKAVLAAVQAIVKRAMKLAARALPLYTAWSVIELLADALGIEVESVYNDVKYIRDLWYHIQELGRKLEQLLGVLEGYFEAFEQVLAAVRTIPDIDSVAEVQDTAGEIAAGKKAMKKQGENLGETAEKAGKQVEQVNADISRLEADLNK